MLSVFFVKAGILPTKVSALGIELQATEQSAFLSLMALGLFYFTVAFLIYAMSDFIVWRNAVTKEYVAWYSKMMSEIDAAPRGNSNHEVEIETIRAYERNRKWSNLTKPVSIARGLFEFALPLFVAAYSIYILLANAMKVT
jgi:Ca2+/Na+ antiporter